MVTEASALAAPYCDAVELNCGCPQRCARKDGYGAYLMENPGAVTLITPSLIASSLLLYFTVDLPSLVTRRIYSHCPFFFPL